MVQRIVRSLQECDRECLEPSCAGFGGRSEDYIGVLRLKVVMEIDDCLESVVVIPTSLVLAEVPM